MVTAVSQKRRNRCPPAVVLDGGPERFHYRRSPRASTSVKRLRTDAFQLGGGHDGAAVRGDGAYVSDAGACVL